MTADGFDNWLEEADSALREWVSANGFTGTSGRSLLLPGGDSAAIGILDSDAPLWDASRLAASLPAASWRIDSPDEGGPDLGMVCLGWALAQYRFTAYRAEAGGDIRRLVIPESLSDIDKKRLAGLAGGVAFCRDLINAPANHMTPAGLEDAARHLATRFGAAIEVTEGAALDVFTVEPLPRDHAFWTHPRVRVWPHVAAQTNATSAADQVAAAITAMMDGSEPANRVDWSRGY